MDDKCVTRCVNGGAMKLISEAPSAPLPGESAPTATRAEPSSEATITECPGTPGATDWNDCGCQYDAHGEPRWFDDRYKCVKCPDGEQALEASKRLRRASACGEQALAASKRLSSRLRLAPMTTGFGSASHKMSAIGA